MLHIHSFGQSDRGLRRANNEDVFLVKPEKGFFLVADGMGGAAAGEVASQIFAETALEIFSNKQIHSEQEAIQWAQEFFGSANERILNQGRQNPHYQGMGCTGELLVLYDENYLVGHVGDSRTYLFRQNQLRQLTRDHSVVQDQIDQGVITPEEGKMHSLKNIILRAVGIEETLAVDLVRGKIFPGDLFLLCSDGLTDMVGNPAIQEVVSLFIPLDQKGEKLIELAKSEGGYDNITVVLCEVAQL
jgi:serine/threonine protein phosphatase PrpC